MGTLITAAATALKGVSLAQAFQIGGTILSAAGSISQGRSQKAVADYQAAQLEAKGKAENAAAQREALNELRQKELVQSRARAVAAASGGGQDFKLLGDIEEEGEYRAQTALWQGEEAAKGRRGQAAAARYEGKRYSRAGFLNAGKTLLSGGATFMENYGGDNFLKKYGS